MACTQAYATLTHPFTMSQILQSTFDHPYLAYVYHHHCLHHHHHSLALNYMVNSEQSYTIEQLQRKQQQKSQQNEKWFWLHGTYVYGTAHTYASFILLFLSAARFPFIHSFINSFKLYCCCFVFVCSLFIRIVDALVVVVVVASTIRFFMISRTNVERKLVVVAEDLEWFVRSAFSYNHNFELNTEYLNKMQWKMSRNTSKTYSATSSKVLYFTRSIFLSLFNCSSTIYRSYTNYKIYKIHVYF